VAVASNWFMGGVGSSAIAADVVPTVLRIIFDGENAGVLPKHAVADGIDDVAEGRETCCDIFPVAGSRTTSSWVMPAGATN